MCSTSLPWGFDYAADRHSIQLNTGRAHYKITETCREEAVNELKTISKEDSVELAT